MFCQVLALCSDLDAATGPVTTQRQSGNPTVGTGVRNNFTSTESALKGQSIISMTALDFLFL